MANVSLKTLLVPSKEVDVEYPGLPGFVISVSFLSRETLQTIRKKSTKTTFKNRQPVEELNDDLFLELYVKGSIKGWKGLKMSYLEQLAPVDVSASKPEDELEFNEENALQLMKASTNFDAFISEQVTDLSAFTANKSK